MNALLHRVRQFLDRHTSLADGARLVVGVSGGADSMVCLDVLRCLGYAVQAAHVHYGLRPEADDEAATVARWCDAHAIPLHVAHRDPTARADTDDTSIQAVAREQRYAFFADVAAQISAPAVAVGHHRDDQAETILLHLMRGSGVEGLAGMPPVRPLASGSGSPLLLRPLLDERRATLEAYADAHEVPWHVDSSNRDPSYRRGCVRTTVLPALNACADGSTDTIARTAALVRGYLDTSWTPELQKRFARCHASRPAGGWLDLFRLRNEPPVWRGRVLVEALRHDLPTVSPSRAVVQELNGLLHAQVGRRVVLDEATVWRERGGLRLVPASASLSLQPASLPLNATAALSTGAHLRAETKSERPATLHTGTPHVVYADRDRLRFPLTVRPWASGDRLRPLGMRGTKRVSDLLTDARVPPHRRRTTPVVLSGDTIVWVVGQRLAHDARVRPTTERIVQLAFQPTENV